MVKVRDTHFVEQGQAPDPSRLLAVLSADRRDIDATSLTTAWQLVVGGLGERNQQQENLQQILQYGIEVAAILAELQLDRDSVLAGFLYPAVAQGVVQVASVRNHFGDAVARLVEGVARMEAVGIVPLREDSDTAFEQQHRQQETVRRMLVAMIDDVRVALIKIAERSQALRSVKDRPEEQISVAREVFDVYAPLAHRLGIGQLKWELEDLAFRYLQPDEYRRIANMLDERRIDRQQYIDSVTGQLRVAMEGRRHIG